MYVTGTFDDWGKTIKLEKVGGSFEKNVDLPASSEKIYYKVSLELSGKLRRTHLLCNAGKLFKSSPVGHVEHST